MEGSGERVGGNKRSRSSSELGVGRGLMSCSAATACMSSISITTLSNAPFAFVSLLCLIFTFALGRTYNKSSCNSSLSQSMLLPSVHNVLFNLVSTGLGPPTSTCETCRPGRCNPAPNGCVPTHNPPQPNGTGTGTGTGMTRSASTHEPSPTDSLPPRLRHLRNEQWRD
jgi:hypothetical protein